MNFLNNKKGILIPTNVLMAFTFVASLLTILSVTGYIDLGNSLATITGSGDYIERPVFKYMKCEAVSGLKWTDPTAIATNGMWLVKPSVTNSYNVELKSVDKGFADVPYFSYSICNSKIESDNNCRIFGRLLEVARDGGVGKTYDINNIRPEEYVRVDYRTHGTPFNLFKDQGISGSEYQLNYIPYGLREYNVLAGSSNQINPNSCEVPTSSDSWRDRFISSDSDKIRNKISSNVNERILQPQEVRWFVAGYITSASPSFKLNYGGKDAWCRPTGSTGEIYEINKIKVGSGTYKVASADWSDYLGSVGCCPQDARGSEVCNSNYQWESIAGSEVGDFGSCGSPNWISYSEQEIIKYSKVNGICTSETKAVECANDFDCKDANQLCDLNSFTCIEGNVNLKGQKIETIPDNVVDCEAKGGEWIKETSEDSSLLNFIGIGEPDVIVMEYCEMDEPFDFVFWVAVGFMVVALFLFRMQLFAGFRFILSKFGVKI